MTRLAFPIELGTGPNGPITARTVTELVNSGPFLAEAIQAAYGTTADAAHAAASSIEHTLYAARSSSSHGADYATWLADVPAPILTCLIDLAVMAPDDYFATQHQLRLARLVLGELATTLRQH